MEKKVLKDDAKDKVIDDFVVDKDKKGRYWLITYYNEDITQKVLEGNVRSISKDSTISKHIESIVGQIEIGESTGEKHIHLSITFSDSKFRPLVAFKKVLGDNININSRSISYNSYCSKDITRDKGTEKVLWGIEEDEINVYERREEEEESKEEDEELEKEKENRLVGIEKDIVEVKKLGGIIDKQKISIDKLVKDREEDKKEIDNLSGLVKTLIEQREEDKTRIDKLVKDKKEKTKLLEELYEANDYLYTKLKVKKEKTSKKKEKSPSEKKKSSKKKESKKKA